MAYKPIESYGVIGDMHTVALVARDGSIDWCCLPNFDSPSIFAALLDDQKGGYFRIYTTGQIDRYQQMYLPDTNVLVTRFLSAQGVGEIVDFMPVREDAPKRVPIHQIVRIARAIRGPVHFRLECRPRFDYARQSHRLVIEDRGALFEASGMHVALRSRLPLQRDGDDVTAEFTLEPKQSEIFVLSHIEREEDDRDPLDPHMIEEEIFPATIEFWKHWLAKCRYEGRWREIVYRSAMVLKLLTYQPTGAIVASPTCSLPERIGGERNWDYRYTWIRDAAFTIYAFLKLGYYEEAANFMQWLQQRALEHGSEGPLQIMYGIDGRKELPEIELAHLDGYRGSRPVHTGNAATGQLQLDIYGELLDAIYLYNKHARPISYDLWCYLRPILDWVCENWERPDSGIWEPRIGPQQLVYSKMQCWVALDRGLRIAEKRRLPVDYDRLRREATRIYETVMEKGFDKQRNTFVQAFGSDALDASTLLMALMLFVSPSDPRMLGTIDAITRNLVSDSLVYRYEGPDGPRGREGTFSMCTFWLAEVLARAGQVDEGRLIFEKMLTYANHLGLFAEEIGASGEMLGNFPQAFTHLGLISAALFLDKALGSRP